MLGRELRGDPRTFQLEATSVGYELEPFANVGLDADLLEALIDAHERDALPRLARLWRYYRNTLGEATAEGGSDGPPGQAVGLPPRLTEITQLSRDDRFSRETVIENDIMWRVHTLADFMFPAPPRIVSRADDEAKAEAIQEIVEAVIRANGGTDLWHNAVLLGSVYGFVDFMVDAGGLFGLRSRGELRDQRNVPGEAPSKNTAGRAAALAAAHVSIETVEAPRAIPLINGADYREIDAYILHFNQPANAVKRPGLLERLAHSWTHGFGKRGNRKRDCVTVTEIHTADRMQRYEDGVLVAEAINRIGRLPVVHVQNLNQPLCYEGLSDVEALIPLQDELNIRLSDRANRVTMQSFRMWLGKGIDGFTDRPVGPGQMWVTDNLEASIESFGGDAASPSEEAHIREIREAMDRASGVTPAAAGHIQSRVGNLSSENAMRISLIGTINRTRRKREAYGAGIEAVCAMVLHALDAAGVFHTKPEERVVEVTWTDPLPVDESRRIADAVAKRDLGVPAETLRRELGYGE